MTHQNCQQERAIKETHAIDIIRHLHRIADVPFSSGIGARVNKDAAREMSERERVFFASGFQTGFEDAVTRITESSMQNRIIMERFDSYGDFSEFAKADSVQRKTLGRKIENLNCCDIFHDAEGAEFRMFLTENKTIFFERLTKPGVNIPYALKKVYRNLDAKGMRYPITVAQTVTNPPS